MDKEYLDKLLYDIKKPTMNMNFVEQDITRPTTESHLGGLPFMYKKDVWPTCENCKNEMQFFMQFRELDEYETVILKTYYTCDCELYKYKPNIHILQYVNPVLERAVVQKEDYKIPYVKIKLEPAWSIPKWVMFRTDYPNLLKQMKTDFPEYPTARFNQLYSEYRYNNNMIGQEPYSKIGGFPEFVSGPKRTLCTCCNKETELMFQLDSVAEYDIDWNQMVLYCYKCKTSGLHSFILN